MRSTEIPALAPHLSHLVDALFPAQPEAAAPAPSSAPAPTPTPAPAAAPPKGGDSNAPVTFDELGGSSGKILLVV